MANIFFDIGHNNNMTRKDREKLIFLEGTDDAYFFDHILLDIEADPSEVGLITVGGKGQFESTIKSFRKTPDFTQGKTKGLAIIKDADDNFVAANAEMSRLFENFFKVKVSHGEVVWRDGVAFGFFLLPGVNQNGDLEELCLSTVQGAPLEQQSAEFLRVAQIAAQDQFFKRKSQVYLAGFAEDLCRGAGLGFKQGKFNDRHDVLLPIKQFLSTFACGQNVVEVG